MDFSRDEKGRIKRDSLIEEIRKELKRLYFLEDIQLIILFGSRAREDHNLKSDLDLAFLLKADFFEQINNVDLRIDLSNHFSKLTGIETDIIILNSAKPLLKFQVLKHGKPIYVNEDFDYPGYFSKSLREHFDFKYYKEYHYQKMRERLTKST